LVLAMAHGSDWACVDHSGVAPLPDRIAHDLVAHGAVLRGLAIPGMSQADHPCGHANAAVDATPSSDPCTSPGSPCAGQCATVCLPAPGAGPALPFTPTGLPANGLAEACPQRSGWTVTGRSVPPESPPPIV